MNFCDFGALVLVSDPSKTDVALITTGHVSSLWETRKRPTINNKSRNTTNFTFLITIEVIDCGWCKIKMMLVIVACESDVTLITICRLKCCENSYEICCLGNVVVPLN